MAITPTPVFPQTPKTYTVQISTGTGTGNVTIATGGVNGTKITSVLASNTDSTANTLRVAVTTGGTNFTIGFSSLAIGAGFLSSVGNPLVNVFSQNGLPIDNDGQPYIFLGSTAYTLTASLGATISSAAAVVNLIAFGADF